MDLPLIDWVKPGIQTELMLLLLSLSKRRTKVEEK
jgi:hypothetical protein